MNQTGLFADQAALNKALGQALRAVCEQAQHEQPGPSWRMQRALEGLAIVAAAMTGDKVLTKAEQWAALEAKAAAEPSMTAMERLARHAFGDHPTPLDYSAFKEPTALDGVPDDPR